MISPPAPTVRRALVGFAFLAVVLAGVLTAVWGFTWALGAGPQPSTAAVEQAVHLDFPEGTEVLDADLSQTDPPLPGARGDATVRIPSDAFGEFLDANGMDAPLIDGLTPAGTASGTIPAGCTDEVCYSATILVDDDAVDVRVTVTLL